MMPPFQFTVLAPHLKAEFTAKLIALGITDPQIVLQDGGYYSGSKLSLLGHWGSEVVRAHIVLTLDQTVWFMREALDVLLLRAQKFIVEHLNDV